MNKNDTETLWDVIRGAQAWIGGLGGYVRLDCFDSSLDIHPQTCFHIFSGMM